MQSLKIKNLNIGTKTLMVSVRLKVHNGTQLIKTHTTPLGNVNVLP